MFVCVRCTVAHDPFSTVDGLLNMSRPSVDLSNLASVLAAAATRKFFSALLKKLYN